jgi:hypothetical protein
MKMDFPSSAGTVMTLPVWMLALPGLYTGMKKVWCWFTTSAALVAGCASWSALLVLLNPSGITEKS